MIQSIKTIEDVKIFLNELHAEGLNFHPDDPFEDYINMETKEPLYSEEEANLRNDLINQAFDVCERDGADIYELSIEIFMADFYKDIQPETS